MSRIASAKDGQKTGDGHGVGFFIPLSPELAEQYPSLGDEDRSPPHTTFLYVGEVSKDQEPAFLKATQEAISEMKGPVTGTIGPLDYFVHPHAERRVAITPIRFNADMAGLRWKLRDRLQEAGFQVDDSFPLVYSPHTTLSYLDGLDATYEGEVPTGQWGFNAIEVWGLPELHRFQFGGSLTQRVASRHVAESSHKKSMALVKFLSKLTKKLGVSEHTYVVGGAVRNFVLDEPIKDIDMVIDSVALGKGRDAEWLGKKVRQAIPTQTNWEYTTYKVALIHVVGDWFVEGENLKGEDIEIATARLEEYEKGGYKPEKVEPATIEQDVYRREFTFNTLLWRMHDLANGPDKAEILDLTGCGRKDLDEGWMRCPSDPDETFKNDPTRMIRVVKFLVKYGFKVSPEVKAAVSRNKALVKNIPPSHLSQMLIKIFFEGGIGKKALIELDKLGLLEEIKGIAQTNKSFRNALANWADREAKLEFLFDLMDLGMPTGQRLKYLSAPERARLREITVQMGADEADVLVVRLEKPGKIPGMDMGSLIREYGLKGAEIQKLTAVARDAILDDPVLAANGRRLTERVQQMYGQGRTAKVGAALPNVVDATIIPKLKKDLRRLTKIYRSLPTGETPGWERQWEEARRAFVSFGKNLETWVYRVLIPHYKREKDTWAQGILREKAWAAVMGLNGAGLFPLSWNPKTDKYEMAPYLLKENRTKNIRRYQRAFNDFMEALGELVEYEGGRVERRPEFEKHSIGGMSVVVHSNNRDIRGEGSGHFGLEPFLRDLKRQASLIYKAGFGAGLKGLTLHVRFDRDDLVAGQYQPSTDELIVYPLGQSAGRNSHTFIHEVAHRYYYRTLSPQARKHWDQVIGSQQLPIKPEDVEDFVDAYVVGREYQLNRREGEALIKREVVDPEQKAKFLYLINSSPAYTHDPKEIRDHHKKFNVGQKVTIEHISDYGSTDPSEAFAEAMMLRVMGGPRSVGPWTRQFFDTVSRSKMARTAGAAKPGSKGQKFVQQGRFTVWYRPAYVEHLPTVLNGLQKAERLFGKAGYKLPSKIPILMASRAWGSQRSIFTTANGGFVQLVPAAFSNLQEFTTFVHELAHYYHHFKVPGGFSNRVINTKYALLMEQKPEDTGRKSPVEQAQDQIKAIQKEIDQAAKQVRPGMTLEIRTRQGWGAKAQQVVRSVKIKSKKGRGRNTKFIMEFLDPTPEEVEDGIMGDTMPVHIFGKSIVSPPTLGENLMASLRELDAAYEVYNEAVVAQNSGDGREKYEVHRSTWFPTKYSKENPREWFAELVTARLLAPSKMDPEVLEWLDAVAKTGQSRTAKTFELKVGDPVLTGKYLNSKAYIEGFKKGPKGDPLVIVRTMPKKEGDKGTKKEIKLFKLRYDESREPKKARVRVSSGQLAKVHQFVRLEESGLNLELFHLEKDGTHYLAHVESGGNLSIGVDSQGSRAQIEKQFYIAFAKAKSGTGLYQSEGTVITDRMDSTAKNHLGLLHDPMWGPDWGKIEDAPNPEEAEQVDFHPLLVEQLRRWKGSSNGLNVTRHPYWPTFHKMVVAAVTKKYGGTVRLYRGVYRNQAVAVLKGKPLALHPYSSWARELEGAMNYRGQLRQDHWVVVQAEFRPKQVALAPVLLPDYLPDPKVLLPLAKDVQHVGDELIVGPRKVLSRFKVVRKTTMEYQAALQLQKKAGVFQGPPALRATIQDWMLSTYCGHVLAGVEKKLKVAGDTLAPAKAALAEMEQVKRTLEQQVKRLRPGQKFQFTLYHFKDKVLYTELAGVRISEMYGYNPGNSIAVFKIHATEPAYERGRGNKRLTFPKSTSRHGVDNFEGAVFYLDGNLNAAIGSVGRAIRAYESSGDTQEGDTSIVELHLMQRECLKYTPKAKGYATTAKKVFPIDLGGWRYLTDTGFTVKDATEKLNAEGWGRINCILDFKGHATRGGMWTPGEKKLEVDVHYSRPLNMEELGKGIYTIQEVARHEVQHAGQDYLQVLRGLGEKAGLPGDEIRDPLFKDEPFHQRQPHALREGEFYTRLEDDVDDFLRHLKKTTRPDWPKTFKLWVSGKRVAPARDQSDFFFHLFYRKNKDKWRKAVKEFQKRVEKELGDPIARVARITYMQAKPSPVRGQAKFAGYLDDDSGPWTPVRLKLANPNTPREFESRLQDLREAVQKAESLGHENNSSLWVAWYMFYQTAKEWGDYVIDHLALPPRKAKAVEMAVRLFSKQYGRGKGPKNLVKWFQVNEKRLNLLEDSLKWPERVEGEGKFKLGPFTVHNTVQAQGKALENAQEIVNKALASLRKTDVPALSRMAYGDLYLVGQLRRKRWAAWYMPGKDVVYLRPVIRGVPQQESARQLVHELGHRLWAKALSMSVKKAWSGHHTKMSWDHPKVQIPEVGEALPFQVNNKVVRMGEPIAPGYVTLVDDNNGKFVGQVDRGKFWDWMAKHSKAAKFPTQYAATDAEEHFCESLSLKAMGKLKGENLEAFDTIIVKEETPGDVRLAMLAHTMMTRRIATRHLARSYQDYVEDKKKKSEKPLNQKDWEARHKGEGEGKGDKPSVPKKKLRDKLKGVIKGIGSKILGAVKAETGEWKSVAKGLKKLLTHELMEPEEKRQLINYAIHQSMMLGLKAAIYGVVPPPPGMIVRQAVSTAAFRIIDKMLGQRFGLALAKTAATEEDFGKLVEEALEQAVEEVLKDLPDAEEDTRKKATQGARFDVNLHEFTRLGETGGPVGEAVSRLVDAWGGSFPDRLGPEGPRVGTMYVYRDGDKNLHYDLVTRVATRHLARHQFQMFSVPEGSVSYLVDAEDRQDKAASRHLKARGFTKLAMFDFDGTLFKSQENEPAWWDKPGPYSWGTDPVSLSPPCVPERPPAVYWNQKAIKAAKRASADPDTFTVLITGRVATVKKRVFQLLRQQGILPNQAYFNDGAEASLFKKRVLGHLLTMWPEITQIQIWENENIDVYSKWVEAISAHLGREIEVVQYPIRDVVIPVSCSPEDLRARVAARHLEAKSLQVWLAWMAQPFSVIWKHHKEFVQGPVDDAMDAIIKELAPKLVKVLGEHEVDSDVDEFLAGAKLGQIAKQRNGDATLRNKSDWEKAGYGWGYANAERFDGRELPAGIRGHVVQKALADFRHHVTEEVVVKLLGQVWHAINPVNTVKAIIVAVKKHGWKLGVGFALFEIFEHFLLPGILSALTGNPKMMALATLPIGEVIYAIVFRILGRAPKELDKADPDGHLDWYEAKYGPVRIAALVQESFEPGLSHRVAVKHASRLVHRAAAGEKVKVRRKDTGRVVEISPETLKEKGGEYEELGDAEQEGQGEQEEPKTEEPTEGLTGKDITRGEEVVGGIDRPEGWRDSGNEPELEAGKEAEWEAEHIATTPGGSLVIGTTHPDMADDENPGTQLMKDNSIPQILDAARKALKAGKKVVYLAEGDSPDLDYEEDYNEHQATGRVLHKEFGDKVELSTWDDASVDVLDQDSPVWERLDHAAGSRESAQASMAVFLLGQGDEVESLRETGILNPKVEGLMKERLGIDLSKDLSDEGRQEMYDLAFPGDSGKAPNDISAVGEVYNAARQDNLLKKIREVEADGGVVISTVGGSHAWNLKPVLEGGAGKESSLRHRVAARYQNKKEVPKAEGGGTTTVYEYSDRQVANRNREKAKKVEKLRGKIGDVRKKYKADLTSSDEKTRFTALAVALMDVTFERVGNEESAKEGHVGVTGWQKKHLTFGKGKVTVKYVGKSGVKHEKVVEENNIVDALRKAVEGKEPEGRLCEGEECRVEASDVNDYLKPFGITAKDVRGFHANTEMQVRLKAVRAAGGKLPEDKKERDKKLKAEFKKALEETAEAVGHEAATLKSQYLVPGLEEEYLKDGGVSENLDKKASSSISPLALKQIEVFAKKAGKTSQVNLNIIGEALEALGWKLEEGTGAAALRSHEQVEDGVLKSWRSQFGYTAAMWGYSGTKEPQEAWFKSQEDVETAARNIWRYVEKCGEKGPNRPERGKVYLAEVSGYHLSPQGRHTLAMRFWFMGVPQYTVIAPNGKKMTFMPSVDDRGRVADASRMKAAKLFTWGYKNGLQQAAQAYLDAGGADAIQEIKQKRELSLRSLENTGTCPACFRNVKMVKRQTMIRHGWEVQGGGWRSYGSWHSGPCFGTSYPPFELSKKGTEAYRKAVEQSKDAIEDRLRELRAGPAEVVWGQRKVTRIPKGDPKYDHVLGLLTQEAERSHTGVVQALRDLDAKISGWSQQPLPGERTASHPDDDDPPKGPRGGKGAPKSGSENPERKALRLLKSLGVKADVRGGMLLINRDSMVQLRGYSPEEKNYEEVLKFLSSKFPEFRLFWGARSDDILGVDFYRLRKGTKTHTEKEDEEAERLVRPAPKLKPPRYDRRRERVEIEGEDPDQDKEAQCGRVSARWIRRLSAEERKPGSWWETDSGWSAKNMKGDTHPFPNKEQAEAFAKGKAKPDKKPDPEPKKDLATELESAVRSIDHARLKKGVADLNALFKKGGSLEGFPPNQVLNDSILSLLDQMGVGELVKPFKGQKARELFLFLKDKKLQGLAGKPKPEPEKTEPKPEPEKTEPEKTEPKPEKTEPEKTEPEAEPEAEPEPEKTKPEPKPEPEAEPPAEPPEAPETPEAPEDPQTPETPEDPKAPKAPETPEDPEKAKAPETPEKPEKAKKPKKPKKPKAPEPDFGDMDFDIDPFEPDVDPMVEALQAVGPAKLKKGLAGLNAMFKDKGALAGAPPDQILDDATLKKFDELGLGKLAPLFKGKPVSELLAFTKDKKLHAKAKPKKKKVESPVSLEDAAQDFNTFVADLTTSGGGWGTPKELESLEGLSSEQRQIVADNFDKQFSKLMKGVSDKGISPAALEVAAKAMKGGKEGGSLEDTGRKLAALAFAKRVVANPLLVGGQAVNAEAQTPEQLQERAQAAFDQFNQTGPEVRKAALEQLETQLQRVSEESPEHKELSSILDGLALAAEVNGEEVPVGDRPPAPEGLKTLAKALGDDVGLLLQPMDKMYGPEGRKVIRDALDKLADRDLLQVMGGEEGPWGPVISAMGDASPEVKEWAKNFLKGVATNEMTTAHALFTTMAMDKAKGEAGDSDKKGEPSQYRTVKELMDGAYKIAKHAPKLREAIRAWKKECLGRKGVKESLEQCKKLGDKAQLTQLQGFLDAAREKFGKLDDNMPIVATLRHAIKTGDLDSLEVEVRAPGENPPPTPATTPIPTTPTEPESFPPGRVGSRLRKNR